MITDNFSNTTWFDLITRRIPACNLFFGCLLLSFFSTQAQSEIPLGAWRFHISYTHINSVTLSENYVFGAARNGIVVVDRGDNSIKTITKVNGLRGAGITFISHDNTNEQLLIAYSDGVIDVMKKDIISSIDPTQNSTVTGSKRINHIAIRENLAYLAADYGVIVFDLTRGDVKETWRDIGEAGQPVKVFQGTFKDDSIFLATDKGILAGDLTKNLLDFNFWKRYDETEFKDGVQHIESFNGIVLAAVDKVGLFRYEAGRWTKENFLMNGLSYSLNASSTFLYISSDASLWKLSPNNVLEQISDAEIIQPKMVVEDKAGKLWIADGAKGLLSNLSGAFNLYVPNGPSNEVPTRLRYNNKVVYALGGGYSASFTPNKNFGYVDQFIQGAWSTQNSFLRDLTDISFNNDQSYVTSFGHGVEERNAETSLRVFDNTNSPLININPSEQSVYITAIAKTEAGLWIANYGASQPLHFLSNQNNWQSFSFANVASRYPVDLMADNYNNLWSILNPEQGGGILVFNKEKNTTNYLSNVSGSGGLPANSVYSIALDRDGIVWVGTSEGIAYFPDPSSVFGNGVNAVRPIIEGRFLLRDEKITSIAVDGGNRKWLGTERGVWLFSPTGEKLIHNFTAENSLLLSNRILDIAINDESGEVFFATDQGLVSFRADATESDFEFHNVKIFPNPVTPDFSGTVGISGLVTDAVVKITDINGKLVWEGNAQGGTASWNIRNYSGQRAATGVYLVFSTSIDGVESIVGKIAVVE